MNTKFLLKHECNRCKVHWEALYSQVLLLYMYSIQKPWDGKHVICIALLHIKVIPLSLPDDTFKVLSSDLATTNIYNKQLVYGGVYQNSILLRIQIEQNK